MDKPHIFFLLVSSPLLDASKNIGDGHPAAVAGPHYTELGGKCFTTREGVCVSLLRYLSLMERGLTPQVLYCCGILPLNVAKLWLQHILYWQDVTLQHILPQFPASFGLLWPQKWSGPPPRPLCRCQLLLRPLSPVLNRIQ